MNTLIRVRIALFIAGVTCWGVGVVRDSANVRWVGIALLVAALLLRFARQSRAGQ
jgi:hypothetical protein